VKPGYFELLGLPLLRGNDLAATSDTSATIIIGSDLARTLWGDADPIGRRLTQLDPPQPVKRDLVVTGVYDSRYVDFFGVSYTYRPVNSLWSGTYLIRTATPATDLASTIRRIVREELPSARLETLITIAQDEANTLRETRGIQAGVAAAGALVLLIGSIGLYGAVALGVGQRRREIGVRMALGARANQVVALFYARGVKLGVIGLLLGLPLSLVGQYMLNAQGSGMTRPRVTPSQWLVGSLVALIVLAVASIATLIPASRAARVNPVTALRGE
jgi:ABC-type antimicrobial peptide transport system permease subunit